MSEKQRAWRQANHAKFIKREARRRKMNRKRLVAYRQSYYRRPEVQTICKRRNRAWRSANRPHFAMYGQLMKLMHLDKAASDH